MITAEEHLLLRAIHSLITGRPFTEIPALSIDWERLFQLAAGHNLVPVIEATLPRQGIPDGVAAKILHEARRRRMRAAVMVEAFQELHQRLAAAGIRVMPIKGIALAHTVYPSITLRYFDDLDLLVPPGAGPAALTVLQESGYHPHPNVPRPEWHHLPPYVHNRHHTMIEIHTDLVRRIRPGWDVEQIWQRARPGQIAGLETWLMAGEDALVYTALHARHNLYNRLSFMIDAALLARAIADPDLLRQLAGEAGARCALAHILDVAARLFELAGLPQPATPPAQRWLARRTAGWHSLTPGRKALRQGPVPRLIELLLVDSVADTLRLAGRLLVPPPEFVRQNYATDGGRALGYGRRLWQRAGLTARQVVRLIRDH
ncbi:MAG: nucleotidyltransferase family protein [Chloroflexi bacterium]|nr:nucleotidyltransferase family protein [Chloroflexota bacterium]MCI0577626.1 nucleotidyltransferase family protein [Chloroflexota bacterium]MCI0644154.1 nucleotidyltransferase family protein [Chloroflexota bacterium]MCI0725263.1 nucleotidyltransferase family protein [Chloroflexota bacterium]